MDSLPPCEICQHRFTEKGPIPYLLSCLHPVCETCVNSSQERISCASCCSDVKHDVRQKDVVRLQKIFHLTAKDRPSDLPCTHGNDGNQAVCWCQECQKLLCGKCRNEHDRTKAGRNHTVRVIKSADPGDLEDVQHCYNHSDYPLDLWDRTCHDLICAGCRQGYHGNHDYEDVDVAAATAKTEIEELGKKVESVSFNQTSDVAMGNLRCTPAALREKITHTFDSLKGLLVQREKELLAAFDQNVAAIQADMRKNTSSESRRMLIKDYIDNVLLYSSKNDLLTQRKVIEEPVEIFLASASRKDSTLPVFNTEGLASLQGMISSFGGISTLRQDVLILNGKHRQKVDNFEDVSKMSALPGDTKLHHQSEKSMETKTLIEESRKIFESQTDVRVFEIFASAPKGRHREKADKHGDVSKVAVVPRDTKLHQSENPWKPKRKLEKGKSNEVFESETDSAPKGKHREKADKHGDVSKVAVVPRDTKLHQSENPWKPKRKLKKGKSNEVFESKTDELSRAVRMILNKVTPTNFKTMITEINRLVIDTESKLQRVVDLMFEKAVKEILYSTIYANMCRYLLTMKVPSDTRQGEIVNFRVILLTTCQREFERCKEIQRDLDGRKEAVNAEETNERTTKMEGELETAVVKARNRALGNIRFMGELFNLKMLTENIMHDCVFKLIRSLDEISLECVCLLLITVGKELDTVKAKRRMDQYFQQMKKLISQRKVSFRCMFKIQDVVDLRENDWTPRHEELRPKPIDEIRKDAKSKTEEQSRVMPPFVKQKQLQSSRAAKLTNRPVQKEVNTVTRKSGEKRVDSGDVVELGIVKNIEGTDSISSESSSQDSHTPMAWVRQNISKLFCSPKIDNETVFGWIETYVPDDVVKTPSFIRVLVTAVSSSALNDTGKTTNVDQNVMRTWKSLLLKYLDHQQELELQTLYALQALVNTLGHPQGVLHTFFDTLYDEEIIAVDVFKQWEVSKEEPEGKEQALEQVASFFAGLCD